MPLRDVTDDTFDAEVLNASGPVVVDFWAEWCSSCKAMMPHIDAVASELDGKVKILKLDIEDAIMTAGKLGIRGVPTVMLFQDGKLTATKVGSMSRAGFHQWLTANAPDLS